MSKLKTQKFMTLFNEMLTDRNGVNNLKNVQKISEKGDEVDNINFQKEMSMNMRLTDRKILFLKKVEEAKQKILDGNYGECEDCGDDISQKRLLARPTAKLCIDCQEEKERDDFGNFNKRRDLIDKKFSEDVDQENVRTLKTKTYGNIADIGFESVVDM